MARLQARLFSRMPPRPTARHRHAGRSFGMRWSPIMGAISPTFAHFEAPGLMAVITRATRYHGAELAVGIGRRRAMPPIRRRAGTISPLATMRGAPRRRAARHRRHARRARARKRKMPMASY